MGLFFIVLNLSSECIKDEIFEFGIWYLEFSIWNLVFGIWNFLIISSFCPKSPKHCELQWG